MEVERGDGKDDPDDAFRGRGAGQSGRDEARRPNAAKGARAGHGEGRARTPRLGAEGRGEAAGRLCALSVVEAGGRHLRAGSRRGAVRAAQLPGRGDARLRRRRHERQEPIRHDTAPGARRVRGSCEGRAEHDTPRPRQLVPPSRGLHGQSRHVGRRQRGARDVPPRKRPRRLENQR